MAEARIDILGRVEPLEEVVKFRNALENANDSAKELTQTTEQGFNKASKAVNETTEATKKGEKETKRQLGIVEKLENEYKQLRNAARQATDPQDLQRLNKAAEDVRKELEGAQKAGLELAEEGKKATGAFSNFSLGGVGGIASGLGIASVGALAGAAVNDVRKTVEEFTKLRGETQQLTGAIGTDLDGIVVKTQSIAETFDQEFNETLRAANTLSNEFQISQEEALGVIEQGFLAGANASGDFLDSVREYPAQFADAGGSAEQFLKVLVSSQQEGIFSDKGIDAVKEFNLRITEQTKSTRDAVVRLLGKDQADELLGGVRDGSITSVDALKTISEALGDNTKDSATLKTAVADIFAGPGEDAGLRFLQTLKDIDGTLIDVDGSTNALIETQSRELALQEDLAAVQNRLAKEFETNGNIFNEILLNLEIGWNEVVLATNAGAKAASDFRFSFSDDIRGATEDLGIFGSLIEGFLGNAELGAGFFDGFVDSVAPAAAAFENLENVKPLTEAEKQAAKFKQEILDASAELEGLQDRRSTERVVRGGFKIEEEATDEQLQSIIDAAKENLDGLGLDLSEEINASLDAQREKIKEAGKKPTVEPSTVVDSLDPAEAERIQKEEEARLKKLETARVKFNTDIDRLQGQAAQNEIANLEGEELIAAQLAFNDEQISILEDRLLQELEAIELSGEERLAAEERIEESIGILRTSAIEEANQKIRETRISEAEKDLALQEEIAEQTALLDLSRQDGESEIEFERRKQEELLAIQLEFAKKRLDAFGETLTEEEQLAKLQLENLVKDLNTEISTLGEGTELKGIDGFVSKLFDTTDQTEINGIKDGVAQIGGELVGLGTQFVDNQIEQNANLIGSIDDQISDVESNIQEQEELRAQGLANNVAREEDALDALNKKRAEAVAEQEKLRKKQAAIELLQQIGSLITAAAQIANAESGKGAIGVAIAIGAIATLFGAFAKFKGDANNLAKAEDGAFVSDAFSMIGGKRHSQGGTPMALEAEIGEAHTIWTRSATAKHGKKLAEATALINAGVDPEHVFGLNFDLPDQIRAAQDQHQTVIVQNQNAQLVAEIGVLQNEMKVMRAAIENLPSEVAYSPGQVVRTTVKGKVTRRKIADV